MTTEWTCKRCHHSTTTKSNLLSHLRNKKECIVDVKNGGNNISIQDYIDKLLEPKNPKNYSCPHCDSRFSYNQSMNKHIRDCKHNPVNAENGTTQQEVTNVVIQDTSIDELRKHIHTQDELIMFYRKENDMLRNQQVIQVVFNINDNIPKKQYKKKNIPHSVKIKCWNTHVGELIPKVKCLCCHNIDITQHNFQCGHIIAECDGGSLDIDNLLPICNVCNYSMGSTNMNEFRLTYGFS